MRRATPKNRRHAGPTTRLSDEQFVNAYGSLLGPQTVRMVAAEANVSHVTIITWRRQARAAAREIDLDKILKKGQAYCGLFIKNGPELAKVLGVSRNAAKGLEIILRGSGLLKGSRVDNIFEMLKRSRTPIEKRAIMKKYHLSKTEFYRLVEKMGGK